MLKMSDDFDYLNDPENADNNNQTEEFFHKQYLDYKDDEFDDIAKQVDEGMGTLDVDMDVNKPTDGYDMLSPEQGQMISDILDDGDMDTEDDYDMEADSEFLEKDDLFTGALFDFITNWSSVDKKLKLSQISDLIKLNQKYLVEEIKKFEDLAIKHFKKVPVDALELKEATDFITGDGELSQGVIKYHMKRLNELNAALEAKQKDEKKAFAKLQKDIEKREKGVLKKKINEMKMKESHELDRLNNNVRTKASADDEENSDEIYTNGLTSWFSNWSYKGKKAQIPQLNAMLEFNMKAYNETLYKYLKIANEHYNALKDKKDENGTIRKFSRFLSQEIIVTIGLLNYHMKRMDEVVSDMFQIRKMQITKFKKVVEKADKFNKVRLSTVVKKRKEEEASLTKNKMNLSTGAVMEDDIKTREGLTNKVLELKDDDTVPKRDVVRLMKQMAVLETQLKIFKS